MILNKNTTKENFDFVVNTIYSKYNFIKKSNIQAIFVKELPNADLLLANKEGGNGKTTHIACTGESRQFFGDFIANTLINETSDTFYDTDRHDYKFKIFIEEKYVNNKNNFIKSHCALWINIKKDENQIGLSKDKFDDSNFKQLRRCMFKDNILIFFKYLNTNENIFDYYLILIKDENERNNLIRGIGTLKNKPRYAALDNDNNNNNNITHILEADSPYTSTIINPCNNIGFNKIFYGCPGVGKSYKIDKEYNSNIFRTTFHPEYTYYDFVGSIRPQIDYNLNPPTTNYMFLPGDFTKALKFAIDNPNEVVNFVIEELNRADTSAVFGDIFQLLDRDDLGYSKYYITNENIARVIYEYSNTQAIEEWLGIDVKKHQVKLPNNLNIIASMNTSDQNINALDSAFIRRWDQEYIPIDFTKLTKSIIISGLNVDWSKFVECVNERILDSGMMNAEDKQLGPFFAKESTITNEHLFSNKILVYLWKDVFKVNKSIIFNTDNVKGINSLVTLYSKDPLSVFNDDFKKDLNL
ncbi:MAG: AAA family ATPase [Romboutsia timonensis]|uniref:AAA family ATPase n=1 Tax=Romboutsia timonensis TaxID=1776391 RepID=UPI002A764841|nr:AAA family ATPase [Romboutsia timonensis]MDY2883833.1 AAA family ATPase [Romboutsia timonensis]